MPGHVTSKTHAGVIDAICQFSDREAAHRVHPVPGDLGQRDEHEGARREPRVRDAEARLVDSFLAVQKDVDIELAGAVPDPSGFTTSL